MRKSFTRLFGFLLLSVMMLFTTVLYADDIPQTQSTIELVAPSVNKCYNLTNSYTADVQVKDFIAMKSFDLTLNYDKSTFGVMSVVPVTNLGGTFTWSADPVNGKLNMKWTNPTAVTYADNAYAKLFTVTFYLLNPSITATSYSSTLTWASNSYLYYDSNWAAGTTYQTNTTAFTGGSLTVPVSITADAIQTTVTAPSCAGSQAVITVTSPIGTGYKYYFNGSATGSVSPTAIANAPSTNTVVVVDASGCASQPKTISVAAPTPLTYTYDIAGAVCNDGNGVITFSPVGSTGPYEYWVVPQSDFTQVQNILLVSGSGASTLSSYHQNVSPQVLKPEGWYYINVNSSTNCNSLLYSESISSASPAWQLVYISEPTVIDFTATPTDVNCTTAGSIAVGGFSGGTASPTGTYKVSINNTTWMTVSSTTPTVTFSNLTAGTYNVVAMDSKGCVKSSPVTIKAPTPITFALAYQDASCAGGTTGSITITSVTGGAAPYTYTVQLQTLGSTPTSTATWSSTTVTTTGLAANYYSVWVKDANGCIGSYINSPTAGNIVPIQNPALFSFTTNAGAGVVACNGGSYTLTVTAAGGVSPYVYSFDGGTTTTTVSSKVFSNLTADQTVSVTVTDKNGCELSQAVVITVPAALTATISTIDPVLPPTCPGGNDGRVTVLASAGTAPYEYSTNGVDYISTNVLAIPEGTTTISVRDISGCIATVSTMVGTLTPTTLAATASGTIACNGDKSGIINVTNTWQAGRTIQYRVSTSYTDAVTFYASSTAFNPGTINSVANTATPTTFVAGKYYIGAIDQMGCEASVTSVTITQNSALVATVATTNASCFGQFNGTLTINTTGGNGAPTYAIANTAAGALNMADGSFQSMDTWTATTTVGKKLVGVQRGTYYAILKDACGKSAVFGPYFVDGYKAITFDGTVSKLDPKCAGSKDGAISIPLSGVHGGKPEFDGSGLYTFSLLTPTASTVSNTTGTFTGLVGGLYTVTVTDNSGCSSSATISVSLKVQTPVTITNVAVTQINCMGNNNGEITVTAQGGNPAYSLAINSTVAGAWLPFESAAATTKPYVATQPGTYTLYVQDANGCMGNAVSVTVAEPLALTATVTVSNVTCASGGLGTATISVTGGWGSTVSPSTYIYAVGTTTSTTNVFGSLAPGNYVAKVTDTTAALVTSTTTASATVTYTYPAISCPATVNFVVTQPNAYLYTGVSSSVKCKGGNDGSLLVTVLQGAAASTTTLGDEYYVQLTGTTTSTLNATDWKLTTNKQYSFTGLIHGHYTVWIASANTVAGSVPAIYSQGACVLPVGTEAMDPNQTGPYMYAESWEVTEPLTALTVSSTWTSDVACNGVGGGSFTVNAAGGSGSYKYLAKLSTLPNHVLVDPVTSSEEWQTSNVFTNKAVGTWVVWAMDSNGCIKGGEGGGTPVDAYRVQIRQPQQVSFTALKTSDVSCYAANDGKITITPIVSAGAPYTYMITGLDYNSNTVTITGTTTSTTQASYVITGIPANTTSGTTATNVYTITILDKNGCTSTSTTVASVSQSQILTANLVKANGSFVCPGDVSGVIEAQVTGGKPAYQYQLFKDGVVYTAVVSIPSFIVEVGHTWTIQVKDANGCTASSTIELNAPLAIKATMQETTCFSDATASVIINATGEAGRTFQYQFKANTAASYSAWANVTDQPVSGFIFANELVTQNFYYFNVKDNMGCTTSFTYSFVPTQNELKATVTGTGGTATVTINGGIAPYSYMVGTASKTTISGSVSGGSYVVDGLVDGTNSITIYDDHGCSKVVTYVADRMAPTATYSPNGTTTATTDNHPALVITFSEDVAVGTGSIKIMKKSDNTLAIPAIAASAITVSGKTATVTYTGGLDQNAEYYVLIDNGIVKDLAGNAFAGVTASSTWTFKTGEFATPIVIIPEVSNEIKVYPNPFVNDVTVESTSDLTKVVVSNIAGQIVKEVVNPGSIKFTVQLNKLVSGVYFISLYEENVIVKTVKIVKR